MNNCISCKYYNNHNCNNKHLPITLLDNTESQINDFIEEGHLQQALQEQINFKELNEIFLNVYSESGATKKNINNKNILSNLEENEINITELLDITMSKILLSYFKNNNSNKIQIEDPYSFSCNNWE